MDSKALDEDAWIFWKKKKTCPPKRDLEQLLQGNLSQWTSLGLRQHVEACVHCQRALAKLRLRPSPDDSINLPSELTNTESSSGARAGAVLIDSNRLLDAFHGWLRSHNSHSRISV